MFVLKYLLVVFDRLKQVNKECGSCNVQSSPPEDLVMARILPGPYQDWPFYYLGCI